MMIRLIVLTIALLAALAACNTQPPSAATPQSNGSSEGTDDAGAEPLSTIEIIETTGDGQVETPVVLQETRPGNPTLYGYTNQKPDGNRLVDGRGHLSGSQFVDIALDGIPQWVLSVPANQETGSPSSTLWTAVLQDGKVQTFELEDGLVKEIPPPSPLPYPNPPLIRLVDNQPEFLRPEGDFSELSPPAIIDDSGKWAAIDNGGDLVFMAPSGDVLGRLKIDALPDGRILVDEQMRLLLLAQPTTRYGHGVLGDGLESSAIILIETAPEPRVIKSIQIPAPAVIEGIAPLWADITGDGSREIIVTLSDEDQGAQIVVFNEDGDQIATGPAIGKGYRWRHQLAVAPFGPNGELELVDVLTPHLSGLVEFYQLIGDELKIVAETPGYTSHVLGSRNLDMAVAGDFDGDGTLEIVLPNRARDELGAIGRSGDGSEVLWTLPLAGRLSSNLSAVTTIDGQIMLGAGLDDGTLRIWY